MIQRTMVSTWAIELFLDKLNSLEDATANSSNTIIQQNRKTETEAIRAEFQEFITKHKVYIAPPSLILIFVERSRSTNNVRSN